MSGYGSAADLPSLQKMLSDLQAMKFLTLVIAREQRPRIQELERSIRSMTATVDAFYDRLGARNWIFHEQLDLAQVERLLKATEDPAESEASFISIYRDAATMSRWLMRLRHTEGIRERFHQVQRAYDHFETDQFDSCVLQLLAVMDGFVNDIEPAQRRDLTARDPNDMVAWDSIVGHHLGLTHALTAFRRGIRKRIDEEVTELYRNGIVHGTVTRFDNVVVATKAWNMLFALLDWRAASVRALKPPAPQPSLASIVEKSRQTDLVKKELERWQTSTLHAGDTEFAEHRLVRLTADFLSTWEARNFGKMTEYVGRMFIPRVTSDAQLAGSLRSRFDGAELQAFEPDNAENEAPAIWVVSGSATVNGVVGRFSCRWTSLTDDNSVNFQVDSAAWVLVFCDPDTIWRAVESVT